MAHVLDGRLNLIPQRSPITPRSFEACQWVCGTLRGSVSGRSQLTDTPLFALSLPFLCSMPQDLSEALKEATKEVHTQAENAEFMRNFQKGQVTREGFKVCVLVDQPWLEGMMDLGVPKAQASGFSGDWD